MRRQRSCRPRPSRAGLPSQLANLNDLQTERLNAMQQPMQLGLISNRTAEDGLHSLHLALERLESLQHRSAEAPTNADLVGGIGHASSTSRSLARDGVSARHPDGVML